MALMRFASMAAFVAASAATTLHAQSATTNDDGWLLLRVDDVRVTPKRPGTNRDWDGPKRERKGLCDIAPSAQGAMLLDAMTTGGAATAVSILCELGSSDKQEERDPKAPDLMVRLRAGSDVTYRSFIAPDRYRHSFGYEFLVPIAGIPRDGLRLAVLDQDGDDITGGEVIGSVRLSASALIQAADSKDPVLTLSDDGLSRIEIVVSRFDEPAVTRTLDLRTNKGQLPVGRLHVRAGQLVEIRASGVHQVGGWHDDKLGPEGFRDNKLRSYNLRQEPFNTAPHGAAIARVGVVKQAESRLVVRRCVRHIVPYSGNVVVGVNDREPNNNHGTLTFTVTVSLPRPENWRLAGAFGGCPARGPTATSVEAAPQPASRVGPVGCTQVGSITRLTGADGTGAIVGDVKASRTKIRRVVATAPSIKHTSRADVNAKGQFELLDLPPGTYGLSFWTSRRRVHRCENIEVRAGKAANVVAAVDEPVTATDSSRAPRQKTAMIDIKNATLPLDARGTRVHFHQGKGRSRFESWTINQVVRADLDGDGHDETAVRLSWECANADDCGNSWGSAVAVYSIVKSEPQLVSRLDFTPEGGYTADQIRISDRKLIVSGDAWTDDDARCCGSLRHETTYVLSAGTLVQHDRSTQPKH
ncbi:MAG: carboxypeptidase regulatory-like domain-containing protein [Deltaproteobacteria bacterium]|nr:MAG: carboxypeptidase regulatory-like domain-containing protein [Deltaproteobacteria bacterium]